MAPGDLELSTTSSLRMVSAAEWDALLTDADTPFVRHGFLWSLEEAGCVGAELGWLPQHLLVREEGKLVAAMPLYVKGTSRGEYVFDHSWERFAARLGVRYYPKLVSAVPFTPQTGRRLLVHPDADRPTLSRVLAAGVRGIVERLELSGAHVLFPSEADAAALEKSGFALRHGVQFHWHNRGYRTYDDFLASFNAKRRHQLKRERREVEASGIVTRTYRGKEIEERTLDAWEAFYDATVERFSPYTEKYLNRRFFELVIERLGDAIEIVVAKDGDRPVAGAFNMSGGGRMYGRLWGALEARPFLHFHVCYYHPIEECIRRGLSGFEPGTQGGSHKMPRGFEPTLTWSMHTLRDPRIDRAVREFLVGEREALRRAIEEGEAD
jgi:uncharacterized protein